MIVMVTAITISIIASQVIEQYVLLTTVKSTTMMAHAKFALSHIM